MFKYFASNTNKISSILQYSTWSVKPFKYLSAPIKASIDQSKLPPPTKIDQATFETLLKVSLVWFEADKGIKIVEDAVRFADQILEVDTEKVQPLVSVLEDRSLYLREDTAKNDVTRDELLSHSKLTIENYFVTPKGNIEYIPEEKLDEIITVEHQAGN